MITIQRLPKADLSRIREIDRSEIVRTGYTYEDGRLTAMAVNWDTGTWPEDGPEDFSIKGLLKMLTPILEEENGVLLGALDGEVLAGLAVLRPRLTETMAQLVALFVSDGYRRQGIAQRLSAEAYRLAREGGATEIYVSATPSGSAVGFYLSEGFTPTDTPHPALFELEPEDIHMTKPL
jgi:GNAT superfamily N-acetyltransferase